jgi:hypothetical protein
MSAVHFFGLGRENLTGRKHAMGQRLRQKFSLRPMVERIATGSQHRHLAICGPT